MKTICYFLVVATIFLLTSCSTNEEISDSEKQLIIEELQKQLDDYASALERKDMEWVLKFWSNNPDFVYAGDGKILTDYDSVITYRIPRLFTKMQEFLNCDFTNGHGTVLSKDAASIASDLDFRYVLHSGDTVHFGGSWLFVFKKIDEQWSVVQSGGTHIIY